jgi:hypothetical protein
VEDHCSRVALAPSRSDATGGSALDCDLARREDAPARRTGQLRLSQGVMAKVSVTTGHHRLGGSGDSRPASAAAPGSVRTREGAALADAPGRGQAPSFRRRYRPGGAARFSSRFSRFGQPPPFCDRGGLRPGAGEPEARP